MSKQTKYFGCAKWRCDKVNPDWRAFSVGNPTKHTYCLNHIPWYINLQMKLRGEL